MSYDFSEDYRRGYSSAMRDAAKILFDAATDHEIQSKCSKKVLDAHANILAGALLKSWGNGFMMKSEDIRSTLPTSIPPKPNQ